MDADDVSRPGRIAACANVLARDGAVAVAACQVDLIGEVTDGMRAYVADALTGQRDGHMLPWVVRDVSSGAIMGSTRYHDIAPAIERVEIGHTWYGQSRQRTHVNTTCKLLLLTHAFEKLSCKVVGLRTDNFNFRSQRAIEALGAKKDGVIRHFGTRRDGTVRDVVMYSILATEWPDVKRYLELRLRRHPPEGQ